MIAEKQRAAEVARSRIRVQQLKTDLPSLIDAQVGEQIQKLENRLLKDFRVLGERTVEESTTILNEHLGNRIESLEKVSAKQSETLLDLRDSSKVVERKVSSAVEEIEKSLAGAVAGFKLPPPSYAPLPEVGAPLIHPQFQLQPGMEVVRAGTREMSETDGRLGYCPNCTSTNVRRAKRTGLYEEFLRLFFIAPFRCRSCRHKFYRF